MPWEKGHKKTVGRVKGTPNKTSSSAREAISLAAQRLGGVDRLVEWAQSDPANERVFWGTVYPKLLPLQVSGDSSEPLMIHLVRYADVANPK